MHYTQNNRSAINDRREKVWICLTKGMRNYEIAKELHVNNSTISRDIQYLVSESQSYLNDLGRQTIPFMYQNAIEGIRSVLKECWKIYESTDERVNHFQRLAALKLIKESHEGIFKLAYEGPMVIYVNSLHLKLEDLQKGRAANYSEQQLREITYSPGMEYDNALSGKG